MSRILITGASGRLGKALATSLKDEHDVIGMSRKNPGIEGIQFVQGDFGCFEDLRKLDGSQFEKVVHLGAVTGGCSERDAMMVNVEGTRCLMRYLIDHDCKKFVMASSIAAIGLQSVDFRPSQLPIPDEHPCFDRDGYGISKHLMEEVTKYYHRQNKDIDVINLRLAAITPDPPPLLKDSSHPLRMWTIASITSMLLEDAVKVLKMSLDAEPHPGVRTLNATAPESWVADPTREILETWYGVDVDPAFCDGNEYASLFDVGAIKKEIGFVAVSTLKYIRSTRRTMKLAQDNERPLN